jgi:hypothetical protein
MPIPLNNLIAYATKKEKDRIYHYEWNMVIRTIAEQVNLVTDTVNLVSTGIKIYGPCIDIPEGMKEGDLVLRITEEES